MIEVPVSAGHQLAVAHLEAGAALRLQLRDTCLPDIIRLAELTCNALEQGSKLMLLGNGGSAADAQHIAAELTGRYLTERLRWAETIGDWVREVRLRSSP